MDTDDTGVTNLGDVLADALDSVRVELRDESLRELEAHYSERAERKLEQLIAEAIRCGFDRESVTSPDMSIQLLEVIVRSRRGIGCPRRERAARTTKTGESDPKPQNQRPPA
jgi:hypothetical protein